MRVSQMNWAIYLFRYILMHPRRFQFRFLSLFHTHSHAVHRCHFFWCYVISSSSSSYVITLLRVRASEKSELLNNYMRHRVFGSMVHTRLIPSNLEQIIFFGERVWERKKVHSCVRSRVRQQTLGFDSFFSDSMALLFWLLSCSAIQWAKCDAI